jgi:hypothetical protein
MDPEVIRQIEEELKKLEERFGITIGNLKSFGAAAIKGSSEFKKELEKLGKQIEKGRAGYADQLRLLESLNDSIEDAIKKKKSETEVNKLLQQKKELLEKAAYQNTREQLQIFGESLANTATRSTGQFIKQLQVGASGTELSSTVMNAAIEGTASGVKFLGKAVSSLGEAWKGTPLVGGIISTFGLGLQAAGEGGEKALKFANEVLSRELEKTEKAFNTVNASGAVFAGGMSAMREASVAAGLTLQQFSNVISKQSGDLAMSGMGVAEGARKVGQVGKIFDANGGYIRKQLQRLGYGFEEQAELTATVMSNIRRTGQSFDTATLATETQRYAENLRLISALTGEDAKAKVKQVQEQNNIAAFQAELAKMGPKQAAQIDAAMGTMSALEQKALRDRVIFHGAVLNEEAAIMEATNSENAAMGREMYLKFLAGTLDTKSAAEIQGRYSQATIKQFQDNTAMNIAAYATGDAKITAVQQDRLFAFQRAQRIMEGTVDKVGADIKGAEVPTDELTEGMIKASTAAQTLSIALEKTLLPLLSKYADATGTMLTGIQNIINTIYGKVTGSAPEKAPFASPGSPGFPQLSTNPVIPITRSGGKGKALGGISTGPVSGYSETLHGTEAVVPLPDGRSIPVSLDSSSITAAVNQQSGILAEILRAMQNNNSLTSQIVQNSY